MKTEARFEIRGYIKDPVNLTISGSQTYILNCVRYIEQFSAGTRNFKMASLTSKMAPVQFSPKTVVINAYITAD